jgi:hypothetical protein
MFRSRLRPAGDVYLISLRLKKNILKEKSRGRGIFLLMFVSNNIPGYFHSDAG